MQVGIRKGTCVAERIGTPIRGQSIYDAQSNKGTQVGLHFMLDIETVGKPPIAPIKQIGYATFRDDREGVIHSDTIHVDLKSSVTESGIPIDASTFEWWLLQDDGARQAMTTPGVHIRGALESLTMLVEQHSPRYVWAKPPGFDIYILESLFQGFGMPIPWKHFAVRDMRTLLDLMPEHKTLPEIKPTTKHEAGADAVAQALQVQRLLQINNAMREAVSEDDVDRIHRLFGGES